MTEEQIIDLMAKREYCLYAKIDVENSPRMIFHWMSHPEIFAEVRWTASGHVDVRLKSQVDLLLIQTGWFSVDHPKFGAKFQARMLRALISLGVL